MWIKHNLYISIDIIMQWICNTKLDIGRIIYFAVLNWYHSFEWNMEPLIVCNYAIRHFCICNLVPFNYEFSGPQNISAVSSKAKNIIFERKQTKLTFIENSS